MAPASGEIRPPTILNNRRLAGAVGTNDAGDAARADFDAATAQRLKAAEGFGNVFRAQHEC
jgi:hypothetical protein